jgi:two-component system, cell cycle sensor histidine kinase and response regulator CckA
MGNGEGEGTAPVNADSGSQIASSLLEGVIEQSPNPTWISDAAGTLIRINKACCDMLKIRPADVVGRYNIFSDNIVAEQGYLPLVRSVFDEGRAVSFELFYDTALLQGLALEQEAKVILSVSIFPIRSPEGRITNAVIQHINITERKKAEAALRDSEERFRTLITSAPEGIFVQAEGRFLFINPAMATMLGAECPGDLIGTDFAAHIAPEYRDTVRARIQQQRQTGEPALPMEQEYLRLGGSRVHVETTAVSVRFQDRDAHMVFVRDTTARRRAEAEREQLQAQLLQAQKMESIGRLAGGIAHDFNNVLMVQRGYCEILRRGLSEDDPLARGLAMIDDCAERAAALTRQLLAFSRKQTLQPRVFDLNQLVHGLGSMLQRLIGEDVEMQTHYSSAPATVKADPGQIEQVLINLAVNARDAMPQGGTLTVETLSVDLDSRSTGLRGQVVPGPYVMLAISDTGCGMDESVKSRIFEPFFTTKGEGKGTGLGLATVHGIVHQSGGNIWVYSEPGHGTTFKVYLPRVEAEPTEPAAVESTVPRGHGEVVLVVEDEPALRELARMIIENLGYRVRVTANGGEALILIEEEGLKPDLILTDVIMPAMSGRVMVERIYRTLPDVKVIFMSGYTDDAIVHHGVLDPGINFLQKPFSKAALSAKLSSVLGG